jgi:hypothetical protein
MICNDSNKDGWRKVFNNGLLYCALRDVFDSIETAGTGGHLYRGLFADFLNEAAALTRNPALADLASVYLDLGSRWTELAEAALPNEVETFRRTRDLLREKRRLFEEQGEPAANDTARVVETLNKLESQTRASFPLESKTSSQLLEGLQERIIALHQAESHAALRLLDVVA